MAAHTILLNDMEMTPLLLPLPSDIYSGRERERERRENFYIRRPSRVCNKEEERNRPRLSTMAGDFLRAQTPIEIT